MQIKSFQELAEQVQKMEKKTVIAVVEAHDEHTLESVVQAQKDGLMIPFLIGNEKRIKEMLVELGEVADDFNIVNTSGAEESLCSAITLIKEGKANAIMKGKLESGQFMKAVVNKETGLTKGGLLSLVGFYETPKYHKLFAVSDMGLNTYPDLSGKKQILLNAVKVLLGLGVEKPKVAIMAAVEKVNSKMPETVDADVLKTMNAEGEISQCIVEGPISFDLATSAEAAKIKGYQSPVAGDADLLLVPDIVSGNMLVKCLTGFAGAQTAGIVVGASVPIIFTSRSAEASDKYYSIALAAYTAGSF
ncbi:bifunctional enoyl-CoA hydratase/phosphate acetyltransferase [Dehalobacter sp. DCM]|uniref:bifunctional enoyl-CoA hydratase/phosphate acetyltransferase n=1 Tax=Dehalobacter sp. DCM TaxID=2907827 RepID=UPI0030820048|nr:bifunctional enoyl-CoA hydratase/phosphate acetyltransferase [Dehalobacter sp. DCM]